MRLGFRGRIFFVSLLVMLAALLGAGVYLEHALRQGLLARVELEMSRVAQVAARAVELAAPAHDTGSLAAQLGKSSQVRVTIINAAGTVLGDSDVAESGAMDDHSSRPEVQEALEGRQAIAIRYSSTIGVTMLYVAAPFERAGGERGAVRVAVPLSHVEAAVWQLRAALGLAMLVALALSLGLSAIASHWVSRTLREIVETARALAMRGTGTSPGGHRDEVEGLAGSLSRIAEALEGAVRALAGERDRFGAVLEGMGEAVVALDGQGRITLCNGAAQGLMGWKERPLGQSLVELIRQPELHDLARGAGDTGASRELEIKLEPGKRVTVRAASLGAPDAGVVLVMRDVTELRRLENIRRDFVANVSHELRTPVTTIRATTETLLSGGIDDREHAKTFLNALLRNAERLSRLIGDLLDLSKIEAGELRLELGTVELTKLVRRVVETVEGAAGEKHIALHVNCRATRDAQADEKALEQVLLNLLDNAIKYTPPGGSVEVRTRDEADAGVRIEVCDDGPGVEPRLRPRVFERFFRVDPGRSRDLGGTGLGLSIVKHLVEAQGGAVGVGENEPRGAVFWVVLKGRA